MQQILTIGLVCPYSFLVRGGTQEHTISLGQALVKLGHKVIYFSPDPSSSPSLPQPHVSTGYSIHVPSPNGSWTEVSVAQKSHTEIRQAILDLRVDLLHFQEIIVPMASWAWLKASPVPSLATFHIGWDIKNDNNQFGIFLDTIAPQIKPYLAKSLTSSEISSRCNKSLLVDNIVMPPAINTIAIAKKIPRPDSLKKNQKNLVFVGRLDIRKGAIHVVKAMAKLEDKSIHFHILGKGKEQKKIEDLAQKLGLTSQITFYGKVSNSIKYAFLKHCDLFVAPTTHGESFGMVLIEALAAGCPVIAGNNSAYSLTLRDYPYPEYILDPTDSSHFAECIASLLNSKVRQQKIKSWASKFVKQFSPEVIAKKHLEIYKNVLATALPKLKYDEKFKLSYYELGDSKLSTLVVLHGHRSDAERMLPLSQALAATNHVLTPDLPGSGDSLCLPKNTIDSLGEVTAGWLDSLKLKNYSLVGLSMGGMVSIRMLKYLKKNPPLHLYLYGTPTDSNELTPSKIQHWIMYILQKWQYGTTIVTKTAGSVIKHDLIMKALYRIWFPFMTPQTRDYEIRQWRSQTPKALVETIQDILTHPLSDEPSSNIPTTYICAEHDTVLKTDLVKKHVTKIFPHAQFVTIKLNVHVPKGPLNPSFFKPFLDTILAKKSS